MKALCSYFLAYFILLSFMSDAQTSAKLLLHFDFDKFNISGKGRSLLDSIASLPDLKQKKVQLFGHTDAIGDDVYNDWLSEKRVQAAKQYLLKKGLPLNNIVIDTGLGKRKPLNDNRDKVQRQANRRVEILISSPPPSLAKIITDTATRPGTHIIVKNLNFLGNRHTLTKESWPILMDLLSVMRKFPNLEIEIHGHVCCTQGKEGYDDDAKALILSTNRAVFVYKYLIDNGIPAKRLAWKAFGNSKPIYPLEDTNEKRMQNMRVEIKIIKM